MMIYGMIFPSVDATEDMVTNGTNSLGNHLARAQEETQVGSHRVDDWIFTYKKIQKMLWIYLLLSLEEQ